MAAKSALRTIHPIATMAVKNRTKRTMIVFDQE